MPPLRGESLERCRDKFSLKHPRMRKRQDMVIYDLIAKSYQVYVDAAVNICARCVAVGRGVDGAFHRFQFMKKIMS